MKIGMKKPSVKKSISARTTGRMKRSLKKSIDPTYGKKGVGFAKDPKKSAYNKLYNKTTFGIGDIASMTTSDQSKDISEVEQKPKMDPKKAVKLYKFLLLPISILLLLLSVLLKDWIFTIIALIIICAAIGGIKANSKKE